MGPLPAGSAVLVVNEPGVDVEPVLYQAAQRHLEAGDPVIYAALGRSPQTVRRSMKDYGFDVDPQARRLHFIDGHASLLGTADRSPYRLHLPLALDDVVSTLEVVATDHPESVLILDPVSHLVDYLSLDQFLDHLPALKRALSRFKLSVSLFTAWPSGGDLDMVGDAFDAVVQCRGMQEKVLFGQYFQVQRAPRPAAAGFSALPFRTDRPGGVSFYLPKVLVTGPQGAGKSTFIRASAAEASGTDVAGTTVALDHGRTNLGGVTIDLFGTPGHERFDPLLPAIADDAVGIVLVVDATDPSSFARAADLLAKTNPAGVPVLLAANKQDRPDALHPSEVAQAMRMDPSSAHGCVATDPTSVNRVLRAMVHRILGGDGPSP